VFFFIYAKSTTHWNGALFQDLQQRVSFPDKDQCKGKEQLIVSEELILFSREPPE
jgi:hypothetical protein